MDAGQGQMSWPTFLSGAAAGGCLLLAAQSPAVRSVVTNAVTYSVSSLYWGPVSIVSALQTAGLRAIGLVSPGFKALLKRQVSCASLPAPFHYLFNYSRAGTIASGALVTACAAPAITLAKAVCKTAYQYYEARQQNRKTLKLLSNDTEEFRELTLAGRRKELVRERRKYKALSQRSVAPYDTLGGITATLLPAVFLLPQLGILGLVAVSTASMGSQILGNLWENYSNARMADDMRRQIIEVNKEIRYERIEQHLGIEAVRGAELDDDEE